MLNTCTCNGAGECKRVTGHASCSAGMCMQCRMHTDRNTRRSPWDTCTCTKTHHVACMSFTYVRSFMALFLTAQPQWRFAVGGHTLCAQANHEHFRVNSTYDCCTTTQQQHPVMPDTSHLNANLQPSTSHKGHVGKKHAKAASNQTVSLDATKWQVAPPPHTQYYLMDPAWS